MGKFSVELKSLNWNYLVHWTRTFYGPWPGESRADYYQAVVQSRGEYCRTAFKTLIRVLQEDKIRGSDKIYRGHFRAISFTELELEEAIKLMRWDNRRTGYLLEPFGIAIDKQTAKELGAHPVIYDLPTTYKYLNSEQKLFFQSKGQKEIWEQEKEWRIIGDIDLSKIPTEKCLVITHKKQQIPLIEKYSRFKVVGLED